MDWRDHIVLDPEICHGKPTFRGTRVFVSTILAYLADGRSVEEIRRDYPSVSEDAIPAALAYAAELAARERVEARS